MLAPLNASFPVPTTFQLKHVSQVSLNLQNLRAAMANRTDKEAGTVHGTDPQVRTRKERKEKEMLLHSHSFLPSILPSLLSTSPLNLPSQFPSQYVPKVKPS